VSVAAHVEQVAPASAVPQLEQKRPEAGASQLGQRDVLVPSGVGAVGEAGVIIA
jgi:RES domain-containing protein